ncbi:MAG: molybdenum cofactor biosynthesis protein MoaE [Chlorobi bacterium]|nr:molybdenum cofactor biosynthesis protein MoaE [Chlorobiota bacterium]
MIECLVTSSPIDVGEISQRVGDRRAGAVVTFVGTVRLSSSMKDRDGEVVRLEYEAYGPMAEQEMRKIAQEAIEQFDVLNLILHHRVGVLIIGEVAVCIAVTTPHREDAFDGCRYVIEELKKRVPIWKKEVFIDGAEWVDLHP